MSRLVLIELNLDVVFDPCLIFSVRWLNWSRLDRIQVDPFSLSDALNDSILLNIDLFMRNVIMHDSWIEQLYSTQKQSRGSQRPIFLLRATGFRQFDDNHVYGIHGSVCSTAVELKPGNPEVAGLIPARCWAFSANVGYFLLLSCFQSFNHCKTELI